MGKQGKVKQWPQSQWRLWPGAHKVNTGWQDGWRSGDYAGYQQYQGYEPYGSYEANKPSAPAFPAYDHARPGQHITIIQESRSQSRPAGFSLVQEVQTAVNQARKTEAKLLKLQKEKSRKEQMWTQYVKDLQAAFTKERARHMANANKLQQEIQEAQVQVVEDQQRVQDAAAGCFRGMAGSAAAQQEWDALMSESQLDMGDAPMSNSDLYSMLVRCAQATSATVAVGAEQPLAASFREEASAPTGPEPEVANTTGNATAPAEVPPAPGLEPARGYMSSSPGPALRDPYMMSPGAASHLAGSDGAASSPNLHRHPPASGLRPRVPVKQVVNGVVKTVSPGRQLAAKLDQRRRALIPFGGAGAGPRTMPPDSPGSLVEPGRTMPTLPEAYDLDVDPAPDLAAGGLEDLG